MNNTLESYFTSSITFSKYGKFEADATVPTEAFNELLKVIGKSIYNNLLIIFMTDVRQAHEQHDDDDDQNDIVY